MKKQLLELIETYPTEINWDDVIDFENFDDRLYASNLFVGTTIGVSEGFVEFCPDNEPPLREEILCWIWAIRPDLSKLILELDNISEEFKVLLSAYIESDMDKFLDYMQE